MRIRRNRFLSFWLTYVQSLSLYATAVHASTCPTPCECLGNAVSCENQDMKNIPWTKFPRWAESLSLRQIRGFQHLSTSAVQSLTRLDGLKHLNITSCHEKLDLDGGWLKYLPSVEVLKISHCELEKTPIFSPPHSKLKSLILNRNNIAELSIGTFDSLPNLIRLEVNFNRLQELKKEWFRKGHPLQILSANGNDISRLDPLLNVTLTNLRELRLNKNRLCQLSSRFFRKSKNLDAGSKFPAVSIKSGHNLPLPAGIPDLKLPLKSGHRIRKRQAISNECNGVNNELPSMPLVHTLELSRNRISLINTLTFKHWKSLKVLRLKRNLLKEGSLQPGAFFISKGGLTTLDLTANKRLNNIHQNWLFTNGQSSLRELILAKCGLRNSLEVGLFSYHPKLVRLDLGGNKLDQLMVDQFAELKNLEELNLSGNRISSLPIGTFKGMTKLRKMSLANNAITTLTPQEASSYPRSILSSSAPNSLFQPLSGLVELDISHNRLTRLDRNDLVGLTNLKSLDLRRNNLTRFSPPESHCPKLVRLWMDSSHFACGCSIMPLFRWLHRQLPKGTASTVTANCSHPAKFAGKQLMSLHMDQLGRCGPQTSLEPRIVFRGNTTVWVLRDGNLTLRCEVMITGIPAMWSKEKRKALRPKVMWERVDLNGHRRRLTLKESIFQLDADFKVVDLVAVQKDDAKKTSARWLSLLRIKPKPGRYVESLGAFQCLAENSYGQDSSRLVEVPVYQLPRFTERPPSLISEIAGNVVTIPCSAVGTPPPVPVLHKYGVTDFPAARDRRLSIYNGDTCFTIANVQRKDAGSYVCESENVAGKVTFHFQLEVNEIPDFKKWPRPKSIFTVGQSAVLSCMATGWPFPSITWTKNGQPLHLYSVPVPSSLVNSSKEELTTRTSQSTLSTARPVANRHPEELQLAEKGQLLLFLNVAPQHAAEYECTLLNVVGRKRAKIVVDVRTAGGLVYSGSQQREEASGGRRNRGSRSTGHMTGIIVIAVVVCVVATSLAWVAALYCFRWRKRAAAAAAASSAASGCPQTSSMIHPGRRPLLGRSVSSNSEIFMTSRAGLDSYSRLHGLGPPTIVGPNYHLGMDEEDTTATARYLLEEHRMLRRNATRAYDVAALEPSGMGEDGEVGEADSAEDSRRPGIAPTSDYNTGTSSECSAHSLCISGAANGPLTESQLSGPYSRHEHLPVSASSPLLNHHPPSQVDTCNSAMLTYLTIPPHCDGSPPAVTSFGVVLRESDEYV